ncbi:hypothetical protein [Nocardioides sp. GXZ039]|uniref:hypothetical protein n=1 Tax=Nocardioides sp. GXZ039 TaxID=3136018 RepID=UPI0030F499C5
MAETNRALFSFNPEQFEVLEGICEFVVPGSAPAGPAVYIDSMAADLAAEPREALCAILDEARESQLGGGSWQELATRPWFGWLRALAIEAYYSDFRQPGYEGPGAWDAIAFTSAPMAARAKQDWTFLRCHRDEKSSS